MEMNRILGAIVFAIGVVLLILAYNATNAPLEELSNTLTGRYSDRTMWYLVLGIAAAVGGGLLATFGNRK